MYVIGHRGAMGYEPENTLRSFRRAVELGAEAVELDVHLCKSGELVVIHDETVDRTTNGKGYVSELTLSELKKLDAGRGELIPTLNEVLDSIDLPVNIELKGHETAGQVYRTLKNRDISRIMVSSFEWRELMDYREVDPKMRIGVLDSNMSGDCLNFARFINAHSINPNYLYTDKDFVRAVHERNMFVYVWTPNTKDEITNTMRTGADGMFTNYPDRALELKKSAHYFPDRS